ncbi:MAG TPA: non-homologous end-joining DNA ligase [Acidimicrobiia bacterium]|nr:non-homologous end-joining DNA ligase [Acidimicrobiia bacterium]
MTRSPFEVLTLDERALLEEKPPPYAIEPMLATLHRGPAPGPGWVFEPKLDGIRVVTIRTGGRVDLRSRTGKQQNAALPEVVDAIAAQSGDDMVLDGEVVAFDGERPSFSRLQGRMHVHDPLRARATGIRVQYAVFDLVHLAGFDTTRLPLLARKRLLESSLQWDDTLSFSRHLEGDGDVLLAHACAQRWEGLVAKRADSRYVPNRSRNWLKLKCTSRQEFVIGGWTEPTGGRTGLGALLVGHYADGVLRFAGKVGTGFTAGTLTDLARRLSAIEQPESPFSPDSVPRSVVRGPVHWARPALVCEVTFGEWTPDGRLRHPSYCGLRDDKPPTAVVREEAPSS